MSTAAEGVTAPPTECSTCVDVRRNGYCAPARCYCGHATCYAFEAYVDIDAIPLAEAPASKPRARSSWDDREGATWIDQL